MRTPDPLWAEVREATAPSHRALERVERRSSFAGALLRELAGPPDTRRLEARLNRAAGARTNQGAAPRRRPPLSPLPAVLAGGLTGALAAHILLTWMGRALDEPLRADVPTNRMVERAIRIEYAGAGHLGGTTSAPHIDWDAGRLVVDVTPSAGVDLSVETQESRVTVHGTRFVVTRDALGTSTAVEHGRVEVRCATPNQGARSLSDARLLEGGEVYTCLPIRAPALLGRARALRDRHAAELDVLAAVDAGLDLARSAGDEGAAGELLALRVEVLVGAGRRAEALDAAEEYLATGGPREAEVRVIADHLRSVGPSGDPPENVARPATETAAP